jgi:hypothetical protein
MTDQVPTARISTAAIMRSAAFRKGVEDKRAGRAPTYDAFENHEWEYERG